MDWKKNIEQLKAIELPLHRVDAKKAVLDAMRPIQAIVVQKLTETLSIEWTFHSNAIEGNTLTLPETRAVIEDGITVKGKSLREHLEAV
ncbi:MAG: Fic family protein, partial [Sphingobacteriales bacterium]